MRRSVLLVLACLFTAASARAQSATQTVTIRVLPITAVATSGQPTATALSTGDGVFLEQPVAVTNNVAGVQLSALLVSENTTTVGAVETVACHGSTTGCVLPQATARDVVLALRVGGLTPDQVKAYVANPMLLSSRLRFTTISGGN